MNIFLDNIIFSLQRAGGISVYWSEIIKGILVNQIPDVQFLEDNSAHENLFRKGLAIPDRQVRKNSSRLLSLKRYGKVRLKVNNGPNVFHSSYYRVLANNSNFKQITTVHDFTYEYYRQGVSKYVHSFQKRVAVTNSDVIICVSENTKKDLLKFYPECKRKRLEVVYNGISNDYHLLNAPKVFKEKYLLFIGSRATYKKFWLAVQVAQRLKEYKLYIVGSQLTESEEKEITSALKDRYKLFSSINNFELNQLYNDAVALLYPSLYEGFGIPIGEAMKAGCPVLALNASSIPEVCGDAGFLLPEPNVDDFIFAITEIENNRSSFSEKGIEQAKKFSWENCFEQTYKIYQETAN